MEIAKEGVSYFKAIFKKLERENIDKILQMATFFPRFINDDDNEELIKDKSPNPYGLSSEFY